MSIVLALRNAERTRRLRMGSEKDIAILSHATYKLEILARACRLLLHAKGSCMYARKVLAQTCGMHFGKQTTKLYIHQGAWR